MIKSSIPWIAAFLLMICLGPPATAQQRSHHAQARIIYVNGLYTGDVQDGSAQYPYKTVVGAIINAADGDVIIIQAGDYHESLVMNKNLLVQSANGEAIIGRRVRGRLANPGFAGSAIKTTLFFAGRPLDGTGSADPADPFYNSCGPSPVTLSLYSVHPSDSAINLNWVDPSNPSSDANRRSVLQQMVDAGLNVVSLSTWGESGLPCKFDCTSIVPDQDCGPPCDSLHPANCCSDSDRTKCIARCSHDFAGQRNCRIGWFGAAPMQISQPAKDQVFDAAAGKPILILPFIESRFDIDWDFDDEFPHDHNGNLAPGLISQILDLIAHYLRNATHPEWKDKWARVYDQFGIERYAVVIAHAASQTLDPNAIQSNQDFAAGFDLVADNIYQQTGGVQGNGIRIGFYLDAIPRAPTSNFGCAAVGSAPLVSIYRDATVFKPDPVGTGYWLNRTASVLGIHSYMPEGWVDVQPAAGAKVDECFKSAWKREYSHLWFASGVPLLQDVSPGYDGHLIFEHRAPADWGLKVWGYDSVWRDSAQQYVREFGGAGMVYNAWNGYTEGLAGMLTREYSSDVTIDWLKALTSMYH
jgi:hypothetical protein